LFRARVLNVVQGRVIQSNGTNVVPHKNEDSSGRNGRVRCESDKEETTSQRWTRRPPVTSKACRFRCPRLCGRSEEGRIRCRQSLVHSSVKDHMFVDSLQPFSTARSRPRQECADRSNPPWLRVHPVGIHQMVPGRIPVKSPRHSWPLSCLMRPLILVCLLSLGRPSRVPRKEQYHPCGLSWIIKGRANHEAKPSKAHDTRMRPCPQPKRPDDATRAEHLRVRSPLGVCG